jgi:hypothetical protein
MRDERVLRVFENMVLGKIRGMMQEGKRENYIMKRFIICTPTNDYSYTSNQEK